MPKTSSWRKYLNVYFFYTLSLLLVVFIYLNIRNLEHEAILEDSKQESLKRKVAIEEQILENLSVLKVLQVYIQKEQSIKRVEFSNLVIPIIESNQSIQAIEWTPKVLLKDRRSFELKAVKDGYSDFYFTERDNNGRFVIAKVRDYYFPIYYLEPLMVNEKVFGFDISTTSFVKKHLFSEISKYGLAYSSSYKLVQDTSQYALINYLPVYSFEGETNKANLDKNNLIGLVTGVYKTSTIIDYSLRKFPQDFLVQIYDKTDSLKSKELYTYIPAHLDKSIRANSSGYKNIYSIKFANFAWELVFISYPKNKGWNTSTLILFIGVLLVIFLTLIIYLNKRKSVSLQLSNEHLIEELRKRIQSEEELKLSEERFSKLFYYAPLPITFIRISDRAIIDVNLSFEAEFGYSKKTVIGRTSKEIGLWVNVDNWNSFYDLFLITRELSFFEAEIHTKNGSIRTCLITGSIIRIQEKDYFYAFFQDITERKKAELALKYSESLYREVFNGVNDAIFVQDIATATIIDANRRASEMSKYTHEEIINLNPKELSSYEYPYTYEELTKRYNESINVPDTIATEWQVRDKNGNLFWVEINFKQVTIDNKLCSLSVIRDISERKKAELALSSSELKYREIFNSVNDAIMISDIEERKIIDANLKAVELYKYSIDELKSIDVNLLCSGFYPYTNEELSKLSINIFNSKKPLITEWYARDKEQKLFWVELSIKPAIIDNRPIILSVIRDISERKKIEKLLIENEFPF